MASCDDHQICTAHTDKIYTVNWWENSNSLQPELQGSSHFIAAMVVLISCHSLSKLKEKKIVLTPASWHVKLKSCVYSDLTGRGHSNPGILWQKTGNRHVCFWFLFLLIYSYQYSVLEDACCWSWRPLLLISLLLMSTKVLISNTHNMIKFSIS